MSSEVGLHCPIQDSLASPIRHTQHGSEALLGAHSIPDPPIVLMSLLFAGASPMEVLHSKEVLSYYPLPLPVNPDSLLITRQRCTFLSEERLNRGSMVFKYPRLLSALNLIQIILVSLT